jgi:hypothetical protein
MRSTTDTTATSTTADDARVSALSVAIRWLRHPASVAAIAVLLLNDHVLKAEFGTWWTGKLSDVAGLIFAPALVAVVVAAIVAAVARLARRSNPRGTARRSTPPHSSPRRTPRPETVAAASLAVVGVLFVAAKATAVGAATASSLLGHLVGPSLIRADATDLLALPALGAAWLSFRASSRPRPARPTHAPRRRAASRLATVVTLTVATGAVLASSAAPPPRPAAVAVESTDGGVTVTYYESYEVFSTSIVATTDGLVWSQRCGASSNTSCGDYFAQYSPVLTPVCVPSQPDICFRPHPDGIAVDRSDDGGTTWHHEWGLSTTERDNLTSAVGTESPEYDLVTMSVGILDLPSGFVVFAANGMDGLAVRHPDGTWERRGFLDSQCCSGHGLAAFDVSVEPPFDLGTSAGVASALAAWCLAFVIVLFGMRSGRGAPGGVRDGSVYWVRLIAASLLGAAGLACFAGSIVAFSGILYLGTHLPPENPGAGFADPQFGIKVWTVIMCAVGIVGAIAIVLASLLLPSYFRPRARLIWASAAAAVVATPVALAVGWTAHRVWIVFAATAVAFAVGLAAIYLATRRRAGRGASATDVLGHPGPSVFLP